MQEVIRTIANFTNSIKPIAPVLAGLILVVIGIMYMLAKDEQKKSMYTGWLVSVLIGFVIIYSGASLVSWFGKNVSGF